ncbi:MAG: NAD(P)H-binding protein [Candidatus Marinimicrobia bacterium]|nr:NAD(P)H-binding protein [Candidatus Neomarinimicrobiota bacterium]
MKVAIFGATGFVGTYILNELLSKGYTPRILVRAQSLEKVSKREKIEIVTGNIEDRSAILETIQHCNALIYLIGIIREFPGQNITFEKLHYDGVLYCIEAAKKCGIQHFVLMSANGVKENGTPYQHTKWKAEQALIQSGLEYTIFRPSLIFGDPKGQGRPEFCTQIRDDMLSLPLPAPLFYTGLLPFNAGQFELTPIHVKNVAQFFINALNKNETKGKTFELGGESHFTWEEILKFIALASGKKTWQMPTPVLVVHTIAAFFDRYPWFPVTRGQLTMLLEGNIVEKHYFKSFDIKPIPFIEKELKYLKSV